MNFTMGDTMTSVENIYIILVNWNSDKDTIEAVESITNLYADLKFNIIICDNASKEISIFNIEKYLNGISISKDEIIFEDTVAEVYNVKIKNLNEIIFIKNCYNNGFAYGCNSGIRYVINKDKNSYIWLLNNDTIVDEYALDNLLKNIRFNKNLSIVGSWVKYYKAPNKTQICGGARYNKWLASIYDVRTIEDTKKGFDYIYGASMFFHDSLIKEIGFLNEDLFIYYEELDFCKRAKDKGFDLNFEPNSIIYHKHGKSIGSSNDIIKRSSLAEYYSLRNKIIITKMYYPYCLASVFIRYICSFFIRIFLNKKDSIKIYYFLGKQFFRKKYFSYVEFEKIFK